ncbi:MAG: hypothetical protein BWY04_00505 [candidate division CPR1 bacterium ADurb.Bin160]|uniref:Uncharacterized protein n=1 Tax=candidate division CPR1 bacterium ADurb.Bin160 TaxID=1852826 RepID=A0A1V5ZP50_9BACT|nr:MAG: hypothetical protein BWY04_00505 [candidate division CPR1 bacterium ADurb.Bin160]
MKITKTKILDILNDEENKTHVDSTKIKLSELLVQNIYPHLTKEYNKKKKEIRNIKREIRENNKKIITRRSEIENLLKKYSSERKVKKLLDRIEKLIETKIIFTDRSLKNNSIILLKVINSLSEEQLEYKLSEMLSSLSKKLSNL